MLGKRYLCHKCGTEFDVDVTVRGHVVQSAAFCPFCGEQETDYFPIGSGTVLDHARCYTSIKASRELKRLLFCYWQERGSIRTRFNTAALYIGAVLAGDEPLPQD